MIEMLTVLALLAALAWYLLHTVPQRREYRKLDEARRTIQYTKAGVFADPLNIYNTTVEW